jgi:hypothetical protein
MQCDYRQRSSRSELLRSRSVRKLRVCGAQNRYAYGIELWLPKDVSDITLVSKASLVREREPLRIKSDSGYSRYKNSIRYPNGTLDAKPWGKSGRNPRKQACVLKISGPAPGTLIAQRSLLSTPRCTARTPALRPGGHRAGHPRCRSFPAKLPVRQTVAISQGVARNLLSGAPFFVWRRIRTPCFPGQQT